MAWDPNSGLSFSEIAGIPNPYNQPAPPPQPNYEQANSKMDEGIDTIKPPGPPDAAILDHSTKYDPKTGKSTIKVTMTESLYNEVQRLAGLGAQAETAFSQARKALEQKRDFLNAHPIIAGVGRIASAAAAEYAGGPQGARISPLVHAAGAYGLDTYGQSPDNLNAQIANLSADALAAQQPYTKALETGATLESLDKDRADKAAEKRTEFLQREQDKKDKLKEQYDAQLRTKEREYLDTAEKGLAGPAESAAFIQGYMQLPGANAKVAESVAKQAEVRSANFKAQKYDDSKRAISQAIAIGDAIGKRSEARSTTKDQARDDREVRGILDLPMAKANKEKQTLESLAVAENATNTLAGEIHNLEKSMGPLSGAVLLGAQKIGINDELRSKLVHDLTQQVAIQTSLYGEGARGFQKFALQFNSLLKPKATFTVEQAQGIINGIKGYIEEKRLGTAPGLNNAQIEAHPELFGGDFEKVRGRGSDPAKILGGLDASRVLAQTPPNPSSGQKSPQNAKADASGDIEEWVRDSSGKLVRKKK